MVNPEAIQKRASGSQRPRGSERIVGDPESERQLSPWDYGRFFNAPIRDLGAQILVPLL